LGTVVWSPLAMGVLTGKYLSVDDIPTGSRAASDDSHFMHLFFRQHVLDAVVSLQPVADEAGVTLAQLALTWCLRTEGITSVIVGARTPAQVEQNIAAADVEVPDEILAEAGERLRRATEARGPAKEGRS
jgi:aryl-alcohol dehydrogenase-like predicted oxidoreductase